MIALVVAAIVLVIGILVIDGGDALADMAASVVDDRIREERRR